MPYESAQLALMNIAFPGRLDMGDAGNFRNMRITSRLCGITEASDGCPHHLENKLEKSFGTMRRCQIFDIGSPFRHGTPRVSFYDSGY